MARMISTRRKVSRKPYKYRRAKTASYKRQHKPSIAMASKLLDLRQDPDLDFPQLTFQRLVQEIAQTFNTNIRVKSSAMYPLQKATEDYLHRTFQASIRMAQHAGRVTLEVEDVWVLDKMLRVSGRVGIPGTSSPY